MISLLGALRQEEPAKAHIGSRWFLLAQGGFSVTGVPGSMCYLPKTTITFLNDIMSIIWPQDPSNFFGEYAPASS